MREPLVFEVTPDFPPAPGGIGTLMHRLAVHATRLRYQVVTLDASGADAFDREQPLAVRRIRGVGGWKAAVAKLNAQAFECGLRIRPDVVVSGHIVTSPSASALSRVLGIPMFQYVYAAELHLRSRLSRFALGVADATIAISRYSRDLALQFGADRDTMRVIPPGVDLPAESNGSRAGQPTILTVSRLNERYKGHDVLLRALPLIKARVPSVRSVVVGDGPLRASLERLAASINVSDYIEFMGIESSLCDRWTQAQVFALPSRLGPAGTGGEGFGIVYLEANAHGLPVVAGNVAGALDAVVDGVTGLLVDPTDHVAVADAITELLLDRGRAEQMGRAGAERAKEFAWPRIAAQVEELILNVIGERA